MFNLCHNFLLFILQYTTLHNTIHYTLCCSAVLNITAFHLYLILYYTVILYIILYYVNILHIISYFYIIEKHHYFIILYIILVYAVIADRCSY